MYRHIIDVKGLKSLNDYTIVHSIASHIGQDGCKRLELNLRVADNMVLYVVSSWLSDEADSHSHVPQKFLTIIEAIEAYNKL